MAKRSLLRTALIAAAAAALVGPLIGFVAMRRYIAARTWTRLAACLAGPRIPETGSAEVRVRRIWSAVAYAPAPPQEERWPYRCHEPARSLSSSWAVRSFVPAVTPIAESIADDLEEGMLLADLEQVELLWATAYTLGWDDAAAASVTQPPAPPIEPLIDEAELRLLRRACPGSASLTPAGLDVQPRDRLVFERSSPEQQKSYCTIGASPGGEPFGAVRCAPGDVDHRPPSDREPDLAELLDVVKALKDKAGVREAALQSCRTRDATAAVVMSGAATRQREELDVYFASAGALSKPHRLVREVLAYHSSETLGPVTIACGDDEVRVAWASGRQASGLTEHALTFARCTRDGCASEVVKIANLPAARVADRSYTGAGLHAYEQVVSPFVIDFGDKVALLWNRYDAAVVRVGARDQLGTAPDRYVVDLYGSWRAEREPPAAAAVDLGTTSIVVRGDTAIALLQERAQEIQTRHQPDSVFPLRIGADGSVRALVCEDDK
jgi:hypothetical protein